MEFFNEKMFPFSTIDENQPPITRKQQRLFALLTVLSKLDRYE